MQTQSSPVAGLKPAISRLNGSPEVSATWLSEHRDEVRLIDVREPHELTGPLGHAGGVINTPLGDILAGRLDASPDQPLILICRSGRRSAEAATFLEEKGFTNVASVEGGMLAWNAQVLGHVSIYEDEKHENATNLLGAIDRTNGVPEVSATWTKSNLGRFRLVDVRQDHERVGAMGRIPQAEHVPLGQVMAASAKWPKDAPIVVHCASGGRSGRAAAALESAGFAKVASMEGGMIAWNAFNQA